MTQALRVAAVLVLTLAWAVPVAEFLALPWVVVGDSMEPTLHDRERVLVDRWTYERRPPRPGEIVLVEAPDGRLLIKRVGEPGGDAGADPEIWVYGDNRTASDDSRRFGALPAASVRGRVVIRYWPPSRFGGLGR